MIEEDDTSHRFLPRIREELDKLPLTEAQKDAIAPRLLGHARFLDTRGGKQGSGNLRPDSELLDFASKAQAVMEHFQNDGLTITDYLAAAHHAPGLLTQRPKTIANNIEGVVNRFAAEGLTTRHYLQAAIKSPPLFCQSSDTIAGNIVGVVNRFAAEGLTTREYLKAALTQPSLFSQSPETIAHNIEGVVNRFAAEGLTTRDYLNKAALRKPQLFVQAPDTIARHIDAILSLTDDGIFELPMPRRQGDYMSGPSRNTSHAAVIDFLLKSPALLTLADANFGLREVHQRLTNGPTNSTILTRPRHAVERDLMRHLAHDDPEQAVPSDGFVAGAAQATDEQAKRFVLRALIHAGYIRSGSMER